MRHSPGTIGKPAIEAHATVRVNLKELDGWPEEQTAAFLAGIAQIAAAVRRERERMEG